MLAMSCFGAALPVPALPLPHDGQRGAALYLGAVPLEGRLAGHAAALPASGIACVYCHGTAGTARGSLQNPAPRIDAGSLREFRSRRNGPPAAYDLAGFCRALRTGVDPVQIQLPSRMPRFTLSDTDCEHLWNYLNIPSKKSTSP